MKEFKKQKLFDWYKIHLPYVLGFIQNPKTGKWILYISERNLFLAVASVDNIMK